MTRKNPTILGTTDFTVFIMFDSPSYAITPVAVRSISIALIAAKGTAIPPKPYTSRFPLNIFAADTSRYLTPFNASGISATMISAL